MSDIEFSKRLRKEQHLGRGHAHVRTVAVLLTAGEVVAACICFARADWISAYALISYLVKEAVLSAKG